MGMSQALQNHPRKWDYAIMLSLTVALLSAVSYIIGAELTSHNMDVHAHPQMVGQLNRVEAGQLREQAMKIDERICKEPNNQFYRRELANLIEAWERLTKQRFPRELLSCAKTGG